MMSDKVAIYVRLSREDEDKTCVQDSSKSIENQIFTLKTFAQEQGFLIHEIYMDDGYSGATFERPALKKMLTDMERKKFSNWRESGSRIAGVYTFQEKQKIRILM